MISDSVKKAVADADSGDKQNIRYSELLCLIDKISENKELVATKEATKLSFIMPFLQILGYDIENPSEVIPNYSYGNGMYVDYCIKINGRVCIIVMCKSCNESLSNDSVDGLSKCFYKNSCEVAILTNGVDYKLFGASDEKGIMDLNPLYEFNLLKLEDASSVFVWLLRERYNIITMLDDLSELVDKMNDKLLDECDDNLDKYKISEDLLDKDLKSDNEIDKLRDKILDIEEQNNQLKRKLRSNEDKAKNYDSLKQKYKSLEQKYEELINKEKSSNRFVVDSDKYASLKQKYKSLEQKYEELINESRSEKIYSRRVVVNAYKDAASFEEQLEEKQNQLEELSKQNDSLNSDINEMQVQFKRNVRSVNEMQARYKEMQDRYKELEKGIACRNTEIKRLNALAEHLKSFEKSNADMKVKLERKSTQRITHRILIVVFALSFFLLINFTDSYLTVGLFLVYLIVDFLVF